MAAAGHPNELRVHLKGALKNGCSVEQIQEVLLLLTLYCGIPAANEAHRVAADVLREEKLINVQLLRSCPRKRGPTATCSGEPIEAEEAAHHAHAVLPVARVARIG